MSFKKDIFKTKLGILKIAVNRRTSYLDKDVLNCVINIENMSFAPKM